MMYVRYVWCAVDHEGVELESFVTAARDKAAARKFIKKAMKRHGRPQTIGLVGVAATPARGGAVGLIGAFAVAEAGLGLFQSPNNRVRLGEAPRERSGGAAGMQAFSRVVVQTVGSLLAGPSFYLAGPSSRVPYMLAALLAGIAALTSFTRTATEGI